MDTAITYKPVYLVDLENIGAQSMYRHIENHKEAEYIIFHSDSTSAPGVILENIPEDIKVSFIDCRSGGNNAMDFCICAMAGILSTEKNKMIKILSDDKGYDAMLYMLHHQGIRIGRESTSSQNQDEKNPKWRDNVPIIKAIRACVPKQYQADVIATLPGAVSRKQAHEMLQTIMPQKLATETYKKLKKHIPKEVV